MSSANEVRLPVASRRKCEIQELSQYTCRLVDSHSGQSKIACSPVVRFFRLCPHRPAVEITKLVTIADDGGVIVPRNIDLMIPKARPFADVQKRKTTSKILKDTPEELE